MQVHNCQRKLIPILSKVSYWYSASCYEYKSCNFSVAAQPQSLEIKEVANDKCPISPSDKDSVLDSFTDRLLQQKVKKWESQSTKKKRKDSTFNQGPYQQEKRRINAGHSCQNHQETGVEFELILNKCYKAKILPDTQSLASVKQLCTQLDNKTSLLVIKSISKFLDSEKYQKQACYELYLAEAIWRNEHFENALNLFWNIYLENVVLRKNIQSVLRVLMADAILKKGEAVLVLIINFSKRFVDTYGDYNFLSYVWEHCFLSEWHSDNQIAITLLEEYPALKSTIQLRVHHITSLSLITHQVNIVQRLFEVLLKYEMKTQYELVLRSLFDYACVGRDLYTCSAIVQSCHDLDVTLTEVQNTHFLELFCQDDVPNGIKLPIKIRTTKPSKFIFKF